MKFLCTNLELAFLNHSQMDWAKLWDAYYLLWPLG